MAMAFLRILTVLAAVMFAGSALGWNDRGHMMVAAIAGDQLDDSTQKRVIELLKRNPELNGDLNHWNRHRFSNLVCLFGGEPLNGFPLYA
jgi:hypothetical protein